MGLYKTNYTEKIYTPSGRTLFVNKCLEGVHYSGSGTSTYTISNITKRYCDTVYNPTNTNHSNGVQFLYFIITASSTFTSQIDTIQPIGLNSDRSFGSNYGEGDGNWGIYADIQSTSIRFYFKGNVSGFTNGQYVFDFFDSNSTLLGQILITLNTGLSSGTIAGFKNCDRTDVPSGYPLTPYVGKVTYDDGSYYAIYLNSRWVVDTDGKSITDSQGNIRPVMKDSSDDLWYYFADSFNYSGDFASGSTSVTNQYNALTDSFYYRKYTSASAYTDVLLASNLQYGNTVTVPADSEAGTVSHYTFAGWYYNGTRVYAGQSVTTYPFYNLIYPQWTPETYTVSFSIDQSFNPSPSSVASRVVTYGNYTLLPTLTSSTADFVGWSDGNTTYTPGTAYYPVANVTLTAVFNNKQFTVRFFDADDTQIGASQTVIYPATVNVPSAPSRPNLSFQGWAVRGTNTPILVGTSATTYQPTSTIDLIRVYKYTLTLKDMHGNYGQNVVVYNGYYYTGLTIQVPTPTSNVRPILSGYRFTGWKKTNAQTTDPIPITNAPPVPDFTTTPLSVTLSINYNILYAVFSPAELIAVNVSVSSQNVKVGQTVEFANNTVTINPSDWKGTLQWISEPSGQSYFTVTKHQDGNGATVIGVGQTQGNLAKAVLRGLKRTWDQNAGYISDEVIITVSSFIEVKFFTRNADGERTYYASGWVDDSDNQYVWVSGSFPTNPVRTGFTFDGWVSAEGNVITSSDANAPHYPIEVDATWLFTYEPKDRDILILQRFNPGGKMITRHMDMGVIATFSERFSPVLSKVATPTKSSEATFITDTCITGSMSFSITRKNPHHPNDLSDNSLNWSNGAWIYELRALVDRWQSETDGVKALFIPRGLRYTTINGERVYYGDNYDLMGYVLPRTENGQTNAGLLYDGGSKVLVGYNGIVTSYSDTYTAGSPDVVEISMTVTFGGMVAQYEDMAKALLNTGV